MAINKFTIKDRARHPAICISAVFLIHHSEKSINKHWFINVPHNTFSLSITARIRKLVIWTAMLHVHKLVVLWCNSGLTGKEKAWEKLTTALVNMTKASCDVDVFLQVRVGDFNSTCAGYDPNPIHGAYIGNFFILIR